jgi:S-methylmethionine-dependent homocysteine/selenocysteine methylase
MRPFRERLAEQRPMLLDGATGTELNRRGVDTAVPLWSAAALLRSPEVVRQIHADYVAAGAEVITANTFRTHERNLRAGGLPEPRKAAAELTAQAVALARSAVGGSVWIAGSQAPLEDCYSPHLVPDDATLPREHRQMAEDLAAAGVDLILAETHNTIREAVAATRAATATGLPVLVSFVCGTDGKLLSREPLADAARAVLSLRPDAVLVNCAPPRVMEALLHELRRQCGDTPVGCYANIGEADEVQGWRNAAEDPALYAGFARAWLAAGARVIGGCCGTTPAHVAQLRQLIEPRGWL